MKYLRKISVFFILIAVIFVFVPLFCFIVSKGFYLLADLFTSYETFLRNYFTEFSSWFIAIVTFVLAGGSVVFTVRELIDVFFETLKERANFEDSIS